MYCTYNQSRAKLNINLSLTRRTIESTFCFQIAVKGGHDKTWLSRGFLVSNERLLDKKKSILIWDKKTRQGKQSL